MTNEAKKKYVLVTGANGFIGQHLCKILKLNGFQVIALSRDYSKSLDLICDLQINGVDLTLSKHEETLLELLNRVGTVIHLAVSQPLAHGDKRDGLEYYWDVNIDGALRLANISARADVGRFIFLSSIKVSGEESMLGESLKISDRPNPEDSYAISKCIAEYALGQVSRLSNMEITVIRPPLVYGENLEASFRGIKKLLDLCIPLPFGKINNKRSIISLDNMVNLIILCISHPKAANQTFFASDGVDISTTQLFNLVGRGIGKKRILFPIPMPIGRFIIAFLGYPEIARRIYSSWQVDISETKRILGWTPKVSNFYKE